MLNHGVKQQGTEGVKLRVEAPLNETSQLDRAPYGSCNEEKKMRGNRKEVGVVRHIYMGWHGKQRKTCFFLFLK